MTKTATEPRLNPASSPALPREMRLTLCSIKPCSFRKAEASPPIRARWVMLLSPMCGRKAAKSFIVWIARSRSAPSYPAGSTGHADSTSCSSTRANTCSRFRFTSCFRRATSASTSRWTTRPSTLTSPYRTSRSLKRSSSPTVLSGRTCPYMRRFMKTRRTLPLCRCASTRRGSFLRSASSASKARTCAPVARHIATRRARSAPSSLPMRRATRAARGSHFSAESAR